MRRPVFPRLFGLLAVITLVVTGCNLDEAELIRPGSGAITADVGQLRVLGYDVDPAEDDWVDVLSPDPAVVAEVETFRETDSALLAEGDEPGDRRRLFDAVGEGRTLLVEVNCATGSCDGTGSEPDIHVWEFVVAAADYSSGTDIARRDAVVTRVVGDFIVVVSDAAGPFEIVVDDDETVPVALVATHSPDGEIGMNVAVFAAIAAGSAQIVDQGTDRSTVYDVEVTAAD